MLKFINGLKRINKVQIQRFSSDLTTEKISSQNNQPVMLNYENGELVPK